MTAAAESPPAVTELAPPPETAPAVPVTPPLKAPHRALSMLVHGDSKVGKSLLAASLPKPMLYFDVESAARFLPLRATVWNPLDAPPAKNLAEWDTCVVPIRTWSDALAALEWLKVGLHPFRGIAVDSVSELQYRCLEMIAGRSQMKIQDWGEVLRLLGGFVRDLRDLTMHETNPISALLLTAMSVEIDGLKRPYLQGQMKTQIPYLMDVTGYLYVSTDEHGNEVRRLLTRRRDGKEAGERVNGKIPPLLTLDNIAGNTVAEVSAANKTFQQIMRRVFRPDAPAVEQPAHVEPAPAVVEAVSTDAPMTTAAKALAAEQEAKQSNG